MTFIGASTPPSSPGSVLVYYVYDPHYIPEWGYDLACYKDGKWYCWYDGEELDADILFWAIVETPYVKAEHYWK